MYFYGNLYSWALVHRSFSMGRSIEIVNLIVLLSEKPVKYDFTRY